MLEFAIHDLGANGIGALFVHRGTDATVQGVEQRLPTPPRLRIGEPMHLSPLSHALAQIDGAAIFDPAGVLRHLGTRLIPSPDAEGSPSLAGGYSVPRLRPDDRPICRCMKNVRRL